MLGLSRRKCFSQLRVGHLAALCLLISLSLGGANAQRVGHPPAGNELLVYYANETQPEIVASENYRRLFHILEDSGIESGASVVANLRGDAETFSKDVQQEVATILGLARVARLTTLVFTNALAQDGKYLLLDGESGVSSLRPFPRLGPSDSPVLALSPLARAEGLRSALLETGRVADRKSRGITLIVTSHGDNHMAVMPRVFADLSNVSREDFLAHLRQPLSRNAPQPYWARYKGISKLDFWRILQDSGLGDRLRLVVRAACESGVLTLAEYSHIPPGLGNIAHVGQKPWKSDQIDYRRLLTGLPADTPVSTVLAERLRVQGVDITTKGGVLLEFATMWLRSGAAALLFLPLLVWVAWVGRSIRRSTTTAATVDVDRS
jgi:hypothetical protein